MKTQTLIFVITLLILEINCSWNVNCGTCNSCSSPCFQISDISTEVTNYYCSLNEKSCSSAFPAVIAESHVCSNLLKDQCKSCCFTFDSLERCADEFAFGKSLCQSKLVSGGVNSAEVENSKPVGSGNTYCYDAYGYSTSCSSQSNSAATTTTTDYGTIGGGVGGAFGAILFLLLLCCCCCCGKK